MKTNFKFIYKVEAIIDIMRKYNFVYIINDLGCFLVKAVVTALIIGVIIKTPAMAKASWSYFFKEDTAIMGAIDMACAMVVVLVILVKLRRINVLFRVIVSAFAFAVTLLFTEVLFWHATEIWQLITTEISAKEVSAVGFTLLAVTIAYIFHTVPQWSTESEEENLQEK